MRTRRSLIVLAVLIAACAVVVGVMTLWSASPSRPWEEWGLIAAGGNLRDINPGGRHEGLVRRKPDGTYAAAGQASTLELRQTLMLEARTGAMLPNSRPVTAPNLTRYLSSISAKLAADPRTRGLGLVVTGEDGVFKFISREPHEDLRGVLDQLLPGVFEPGGEDRVEIVVALKDAGKAESIAERLNGQAEKVRAKAGFVGVRDGRLVIDGTGRAGRMLRALEMLSTGGKWENEAPTVLKDPLGPESIARLQDGAAVSFATDPPGTLAVQPLDQKILVVAVFNVRRLKPGPRQRLIAEKAELKDLKLDVVASAFDGPAQKEARRLAERWRSAGADVGFFIEKDARRLAAFDFDVHVYSVRDDYFEDPYPYWHSRGSCNDSGHTVAEIDAMILRLEAAVSPEGTAKLAGELRRRLEEDRVLAVLREAPLYLVGTAEAVEKAARFLGMERK